MGWLNDLAQGLWIDSEKAQSLRFLRHEYQKGYVRFSW